MKRQEAQRQHRNGPKKVGKKKLRDSEESLSQSNDCGNDSL